MGRKKGELKVTLYVYVKPVNFAHVERMARRKNYKTHSAYVESLIERDREKAARDASQSR